MKIIFFGGSKYSQFYLDALKKSGIGDVFAFSKLPSEEKIKKINPDLGVIAYFGEIIPKKILEIPRLGFINVHYSLLPRWRGAAPVQHAILSGDKKIGVTILIATEKVDAGSILTSKKILVGPSDTYLLLEEKLIKLGSGLLLKTIPRYLKGGIKPQEQNEVGVTYAKKIKKEDGKIDWSHNAIYIEAMIRAYNPWPGTYSNFQFSIFNFKTLKIKKVEIIKDNSSLSPGTMFEINGYPAVRCGKNSLKLLIVQPEGKKDMTGEAFLRGHRDILGKKLE